MFKNKYIDDNLIWVTKIEVIIISIKKDNIHNNTLINNITKGLIEECKLQFVIKKLLDNDTISLEKNKYMKNEHSKKQL